MRKTEMAHVKMRKIHVKDLNDALVCTLCNGYLIDATTLSECYHVFCRGCILRHFESKAACPLCNFVYKKKNQVFFKADPQIQAVVYKVVPALYSKEMQRREDFYRSTGVRASSSCSDDSVLERERDMINEEDSMVSPYVGDKSKFFGPEDSISLSLEYYQHHLDKGDVSKPTTKQSDSDRVKVADKSASILNNNNNDSVGDKHKLSAKNDTDKSDKSDKRFLQCPAAVSMQHLQKFVRMKFALSPNHKVDIIYKGEVLPPHFSLMDVAYTFKWKRVKPLRFFYRIFTPLKIQPIKIVNTAVSTGGKQLQVVLKTKVEPPPPPPEIKEENAEENREKERLLAHLQLQSRSKVQNNENNVPEKGAPVPPVQDCVFDYEEPDKEEIKRFAERRDREWALQKKMDESREKEVEEHHHFSKKRKKNKHSKNDCTYKKRKLHAEITNKEEELKLKVKLTQPNGHKHRHHKSSSVEMSSKEKLLQMRQIRHKHVVSEDKNVQTVPTVSKETSTDTPEKEVKDKPVEDEKLPKPTNGVSEEAKKSEGTALKTPLNKEWGNRVATVQIERNEQTEQQAKKTFLKSYQAYAEKYQKSIEKTKTDSAKTPLSRPSNLELKIANLQQRCTIEAKKPETPKSAPTSPQYPPGFTVSKIESGAKRKVESEDRQDKRPSLEITLINPPAPEVKTVPVKPATPAPAKRPPPATIPLDRIKKSFNFKLGISIIPKTLPEKCDNIGALDLSAKPSTKEETAGTTSTTPAKPVNGFASPPPKDGKNVNMSNLQMLSKVAAAQVLNKGAKPRPQMPNLQTLRIPTPNQRIPPSLKMIDKSQFRMMSPQIRNLRPNQNQSIRSIPNPSLLVRLQQNRLNSMNIRENNNGEKEPAAEAPKAPETKPVEVKEVSV
uniref:Polycomb group RING finger protein 4 n=2 Tax=Gnatocerus cornutus TaxID=1553328 RepID=A0A1L7N259_9CUCU|nr:polycomb group RING finger protein 4 [Gnatocerus cornutus]